MDKISILLISGLFAIQIIVFVILANINMKYKRLKNSYSSFMRGKDGKTLEESMLDQLDSVDNLKAVVRQNRQDIKKISKILETKYQKTGIVKYDAFHEMGGSLSFALAMLDGKNNGWVINAVHSREGCYTYIKEIVNGESYIELSEEEAESLEKAVYQEEYGIDMGDHDKN